MFMLGHGWYGIVEDVNRRLKDFDVKLNLSVENEHGLPVFSLPPNSPPLAVSIVNRAEAVARETCVKCGGYGMLSYGEPVHGRIARVLCEAHRPHDWKTLD